MLFYGHRPTFRTDVEDDIKTTGSLPYSLFATIPGCPRNRETHSSEFSSSFWGGSINLVVAPVCFITVLSSSFVSYWLHPVLE